MRAKISAPLLALGLLPVYAQAFIVQDITYEGVNRVPLSSVQANNPVKVGDNVTPASSVGVISDLFKTGYFQNVQLYNQNGTLLVQVQELPTIAKIDIKGNQLIKTDQLRSVLNNVGLQVGNMFNQPLINQIKQSLITEYNSQGKYAVQVSVDVIPTTDNRVDITIDVSEGLDAKIKDINITGNTVYSEKKLLDQLPISTPGLVAFFTGADVYTSDKLSKAAKALIDFYQNHGYLDVQVNSAQASLDSTHTKAYITLNVTEGQQYQFAGFAFKGDLIAPEAALTKLVKIKSGDIYSKQIVTNAQQAIATTVADQGYAFVNVNPVPTVDKDKRTVFITFYVTPGQKVYINSLEFKGNTVTNDQTLRERMKFVEGSTYSKTAIDESTVALQRLPYTPQVTENTTPVPNTNNKVNVDYTVNEQAANTVSAAIGYGGLYGVLFQAGFNMNNLFGSGNNFGINAQVSRPYQNVSANFTQPFFTLSGVSQSVGVYFTKNNASEEGLTNFSTNSVGGTLTYSIPISTWNSFYFGGGLDHTILQQPGDSQSATVQNFTNEYGDAYNTYSLSFGLQRNSTNSAFFPTQGVFASTGLKVAMPGSSLEWYQANANGNWYYALNPNVTMMVGGGLAYGGGYGNNPNLPFFLNYYAGGWGTGVSPWGTGAVGTVRGYTAGQMGPQDTIICTDSSVCTPGSTSQGSALGGNFLVNSTLQLYFPVPFYNKPNVKLITFLDAGNVYQTYSSSTTWDNAAGATHPTFSNIAYTGGVGLEFVIPMLGAMGFSFAEPINRTANNTNYFQFNLGTVF